MRALLAYDATLSVVATLDYAVARNAKGDVIGLVDFGAHEDAGGKLRAIWEVSSATGSATWPEWLGGQAHDFKVELDGQKRITALVHKTSGHRRDRAAIEAAIAAAPVDQQTGDRDLRAIVGGPTRALVLDPQGRTIGQFAGQATDQTLPVIGLEASVRP